MAVAYLDHRLLVHTVYQCRELSKRVLLQTFQEDSSWLNWLRGKQWSVLQRTSKICYRHARLRWGKYNVPCTQTYGSKEKVAVLMLPRFQGSLQRTKTWSQERDLREFIGALYEGEYVSYPLEYFKVSSTLSGGYFLKPGGQTNQFYFCFELRAIYTFYSWSSAVSNRCHIFKTCLQNRAIFVFDSKLDWAGRKSSFNRWKNNIKLWLQHD